MANMHACIAEPLQKDRAHLTLLVPAEMDRIPIEPEGDDGGVMRDITDEMVQALQQQVMNVPTPIMLTVTTRHSCIVLGNIPMKTLDAFEKANIYLLMNSVLIEELAEWQDDK